MESSAQNPEKPPASSGMGAPKVIPLEAFQETLVQWELNPEDFGVDPHLLESARRLSANIAQQAEKKGHNIPLMRMVQWPGESVLKNIIEGGVNLHPTYSEQVDGEEAKLSFLQEASLQNWHHLGQTLTPGALASLEQEVIITHITKEITKVIKLEQYYTGLKPLGQVFWDRASPQLRELVEDATLLPITEEPAFFRQRNNPTAKRDIPNWVRGIILAKALQGSPNTRVSLKPETRTKPDAQAFQIAARWALGNHLTLQGEPQYLEESMETFERLCVRRKKANLNIRMIPAKDIIPEVVIGDPKGSEGESYPWLLCWGFLPNTDKEVREFATRWEKKTKEANILQRFQDRLLVRVISAAAKQELLKAYETRSTLRDNYLLKEAVKNPIFSYLKTRIPQENTLLFWLVFVEAVWKQFTPMSKV
jgi:hypothetical protein